jgi:6-carboxyhexanoate--CoA ligase
MIRQDLYSIRMRASHGMQHISGAERIVSADKISSTAQELIARAGKTSVAPEHIEVKIDAIGYLPFRLLTSLDLVALSAADKGAGRVAASQVLAQCGVSRKAIEEAIHLLSTGAASSGGSMRGAIIMDAQSAERLETDQDRGVRASRFDWSEEAFTGISQKLSDIGLAHFRTREALALATKVAHAPGIMGELCWSDDPDYTAGYVASLKTGYVRIPVLKDRDIPRGGRVFFVDRAKLDMDALVRYLQIEPVLITDTGNCRLEREP